MSTFTLAMDSSQLAEFIACPYKWHLAYIEHLQKKDAYTKALDKGSMMHALLEYYHEHLFYSKNSQEAVKYAVDKLEKRLKSAESIGEKWDLDAEEKAFIKQRFLHYIFFYQSQELETIEYNGKPAVELGFTIPLVDNNDFLFVIEGKIDRMARTKNGFEVFVDYKTQSRKKDIYKHRIQFKTYALASGKSRGIIDIIGLQKEFKPENLKRELGYYPPPLIAKWRNELIKFFYQAGNCLITGNYEQRWSHCDGQYGYPCDYTQICEQTDPHSLIQVRENAYQIKKEWVPWSEED